MRAMALPDDEVIARLAKLQHGVLARRQLVAIAISGSAIDHRLARGRLRRAHSGVYAVGHDALSFEGRVAAAVLAMGNGAVASHQTAAALWSILDPPDGDIHVTVPQARRPQDGIVIHRGTPPRDEVETVQGIPLTSVARTMLDLSRCQSPQAMRRLVKQAEFLGSTDARTLALILQRYPRRQGRRPLDRVVRSQHLGTGVSRSELEDRFLEFLVERGLPMPERNVVLEVGGRRFAVDCLWRDQRLVIELDSRSAHDTDGAFQDDRARDRALIAARWWPMRVTWAQLHGNRDELEADIRAVLARPS